MDAVANRALNPCARCVRLISATHRDLRAAVNAGRFREDLFYRIAVTTLMIPPLRERQGDVAVLSAHFVAHFAARHGLPAKPLSDEALACLQRYAWPGNVRELRNVIESALLMSEGDCIERGDLPPEILGEGMPSEEKTLSKKGITPWTGRSPSWGRKRAPSCAP